MQHRHEYGSKCYDGQKSPLIDINSGSYKTIVTNMARLEGLSRAENKHLKLIGHAFIIKIHDYGLSVTPPLKLYSKLFLQNWTLFGHIATEVC